LALINFTHGLSLAVIDDELAPALLGLVLAMP